MLNGILTFRPAPADWLTKLCHNDPFIKSGVVVVTLIKSSDTNTYQQTQFHCCSWSYQDKVPTQVSKGEANRASQTLAPKNPPSHPAKTPVATE